MKVKLSLSSLLDNPITCSRLEHTLKSIVSTVLGRKIRPTDVIYGAGSHSCYAKVAQALRVLDPQLSSTSLRVMCFSEKGQPEPQHCILVDASKYYKVLVNSWENADFHRCKDGTARISSMRDGGKGEHDENPYREVVADLSSQELLQRYG